jgi:cyclopropane-fatty-acyl-phospholipid synthase
MANVESPFDRWLLRLVQRLAGSVPVRLASKVPEGAATRVNAGVPTILVRDRRALTSLLCNPEMGFGDLYSSGEIEVEGDLVQFLENVYESPEPIIARLFSRWLTWIQSNSLGGARRNIHHHYDIPTDFYQLWLDPQLVYTCAYFPESSASLEEAQKAKLDLVCCKLGLRPGQTVVEAGCGWGALALHMAEHYGVRVKAYNVSHGQIVFARERAKQEGLTSRVEFIEDDWRNITGKSDAFVAVGMLEHIGHQNYAELGRVIHRTIGDAGRGLLHFIGRNRPRAFSSWIRKRVFPGAYAPTLRQAMEILEAHDFSALDVENLRLHYAKTLECWLSRFERSYDKVADRFGSEFARMWRLYLAGSIVAFRLGTLQLFQLSFAGRKCASLPWTRASLYENGTKRTGQDQDQRWIHAIS